MKDTQPIDGARPGRASPIAAVGSLVAARDAEALAAAAAAVPAQLLSATETVVMLREQPGSDIVQRQPATASADLEQWAMLELGQVAGERVQRKGSWLLVGLQPEAGGAGVVAVNVPSADDETVRGLVELGRIVSRCAEQIAASKSHATALEETRKAIGKGLHDLRTPLNSLRLGLHLLEPGLAGQDPQVVQRTHRAVDRLASLVTEMYDALHEKTAAR